MFPLKRSVSALRTCAQRQRTLQGASTSYNSNSLPWTLAQRSYTVGGKNAGDVGASGSSSSRSNANTASENKSIPPSTEKLQQLLGEASRLAQEQEQAAATFNPDTNLLSETDLASANGEKSNANNPFVPTDAADKDLLDTILSNVNSSRTSGAQPARRGSKIKPAPMAPSNANAPGARATSSSTEGARKLFAKDQAVDIKSVTPGTIHYRLYVLAKRANCIMSLIDDRPRTVAWASGGRVGFKGVGEGTYEAGYQCAVRMLDAMRKQIELRAKEDPGKSIELEILLRGFGQGRTAILKALTLPEGDKVRDVVHCITDRTQIKIGGVRLQKARRL